MSNKLLQIWARKLHERVQTNCSAWILLIYIAICAHEMLNFRWQEVKLLCDHQKKLFLSPSKSENGAILETSCFFKSKNFDRIWTFSNKSSHLLEFFLIGYNKEDDLLVFPLCLTVELFQTWINNNIFFKIIPKQYVNIHTSTTFDAKLPDFAYEKAFMNSK